VENGTTTYVWDFMNRLVGVTMANGRSFGYQYDYRSRRVGITDVLGQAKHTAISFSEGLSVAEWETTGGTGPVVSGPATVQYVRGTDMGGGIGGMLYSLRESGPGLQPVVKYDLSNGRGDVVAQSDATGSLTWTASYEAFGRRTKETGVNEDKQRANSKDEDPTGLLNEGFRYRDLETGVFLSRDPAGTVDGPNVYTYVNQNPWTKFDPEGLFWHIAVAGLVGAAISVGAQVVSDACAGKMSDMSTYAGAAAGGAVTGATLAATGSPTLAGAAGGAAASATKQLVANGTVDGGQVLQDAAVGAVGGGLGAAGSRALGCAANKALKALGGAAADAIAGAGAQVAENVIEGRPAGDGVADAALGSLPGAGLVTAVQQRESCFLAGTSVTLGTGEHQAIEALVIGQRVLTPESAQSGPLSPLSGSETKVDPTTWRSYTVRLRDARTGWDIFDITLLRPAGWMAEHSRPLGGGREVWVEFEELNAKGWAEVIEERPCPKIAPGPGRVVTATITHANDDVRTLTLGSGEVLYVTGNHRMFSATRQDWVPVKDLHIGEALRTTKGRESVAALGYQRGRHQVYNLEVETEHCYFVGNGEVLTHNDCDLTDSANKKHQATMTMKDSNGTGVGSVELESGGSGLGRRLSFTEQGDTHTEAKGLEIAKTTKASGTDVASVEFNGELPPCKMCKGKMNKTHREKGIKSTYTSRQTGKPWTSTTHPKGRQPKSKLR
jgi:RHS repeat-associated protein